MISIFGQIELKNIECFEFCLLDLDTGEIKFNKGTPQIKGFTGLYYHKYDLFFAIFPTNDGPFIYYNNSLYAINKNLKIECTNYGNMGIFKIYDYGISIQYEYSKYLGIDSWSNKEDIDLFYRISNEYKKDFFYELYTKELPIVNN